MIKVRYPEDIYIAEGGIVNGTFRGRWHFSFGDYYDPAFMGFGTLRVFNDDTLSPGAVWPLHPHMDIEVVTYCAGGEFLHEDERGRGGILKKGWVQHTTVGRGMMHSEINNRPDEPMRFVQMWFVPYEEGLEPSVERKEAGRDERRNRLLALVSGSEPGALPIRSGAGVYSCYLEKDRSVSHRLGEGHGAYVYVLEGGPVVVSGNEVAEFGAAMVTGENEVSVRSSEEAELLLIDVSFF